MEVLIHPNSELRKKSVEVNISDIGTPRLSKLIEELKETMALENGVGIAAPQIGVHERVIIVDDGQGSHVFINPVIVRRSIWKIESEEGCLSVPGIFGIVRRHRNVAIEALNEDGKRVRIQADRFPSTVFQHEIDHLDGILFIDKVTRFTSNLKM